MIKFGFRKKYIMQSSPIDSRIYIICNQILSFTMVFCHKALSSLSISKTFSDMITCKFSKNIFYINTQQQYQHHRQNRLHFFCSYVCRYIVNILRIGLKVLTKGRFQKKMKKKCGIFRTFQNPPTPLAKCGKKIKTNGLKIIFKQK